MKTFLRIILGAVFVVSGLAKALDTQSFVALVNAYNIGFLEYAAIVIPPLEIILGLLFWLNVEIKTAAMFMMISTLLFSLIYLDVLFTKGIKDCGCFGSIKFLRMPPWGTVLRNVLIITGAYIIYKFPPPESRKFRVNKLIVIAIVALAAFSVSAISYTKPLINTKVINNEDLTGKDVNETFLKDYQKFDRKKRYAVFMFSPECFHCWDMTSNVKSLTESGFVDETIAFAPIEMAAEEKKYEDIFKINFKVYLIFSDTFYKITTSTPVLIIIQNNKIITYNNTGVIHSGYTIKKFLTK